MLTTAFATVPPSAATPLVGIVKWASALIAPLPYARIARDAARSLAARLQGVVAPRA